jgi:hypothetical protein
MAASPPVITNDWIVARMAAIDAYAELLYRWTVQRPDDYEMLGTLGFIAATNHTEKVSLQAILDAEGS